MGIPMATETARRRLTQQIVDAATCPPDQAEVVWHDKELPGLQLRVKRSGAKSYTMRYRTGGRGAPQRRLTLDAGKIPLGEARREIRRRMGEIATGRDPAGERKEQTKRDRKRLGPALDRYERHLADRQVVKRASVLSLLRRELLRAFGNIDLAELDRAQLADRIAAVKTSGRPGAARELKARATVFLGWAVGEGDIPANPLAGWRRPRATRAERLAPIGRALADAELKAFWQAASAAPWPFNGYLKVLLLCGQRRTETAAMRWADIDPNTATWTIPATISKSGREHAVPLPPAVMEIIRATGRTTSPLVFPGRAGTIMSGWEKRVAPVRESSGLAHWTLHDLRRTFRSGLSALGVDYAVRELMLNHVIGGDLDQRYDRDPRWSRRVEAAERWAQHVLGIVTGRASPRWWRCGRASPARPRAHPTVSSAASARRRARSPAGRPRSGAPSGQDADTPESRTASRSGLARTRRGKSGSAAWPRWR
jgi:integrase